MPAETGSREPFRIDVSQDNMKALLKLGIGVKVTVDEVYAELEKQGVIYGIRDRSRIETFLEDPDSFDHLLIAAVGKPLKKGANAEIEFLFETDTNFREERKKLEIFVEEGAVLAKRQPPERGEDGITVLGERLPGEWGMDLRISAGRNVMVSEDGCLYIATITGVPTISEYELRVEPLKIVESDIENEDIDFTGIVRVKGSVTGGTIRVDGNLYIEGDLKNAKVNSGSDVVISGAIESGTEIESEGSVKCRYVADSTIRLENNLVVSESVAGSTIECNGNVFCDAFFGGSLMAMDRVAVRSIGSPKGTPTRVQVGYHCEMHSRYLQGVSRYQDLQRDIRALQQENVQDAGAGGEAEKQNLHNRMAEAVRGLKDLESELASVRKKRKFNSLLSLRVQEEIFSGTKIFIGDVYYSMSTGSSGGIEIKWDINRKKPFITGEGGAERTDDLGTSNTILIVDDSPDIRNALRMMAESIGLEVVAEAEDGVECVNLYKKHRPTLVTCDIAMVNMDGVEALREIRIFDPDARVIMISSITDEERIMECMMSGALDYIKKPMLPSKVITVIRSALG